MLVVLSLVFGVEKMTFSHFLGKLRNGPFQPNLGQFLRKIGNIICYILLVVFCINFIVRNVVITMCKIMIYFDFHHLRIYIDLNERVFIIVTDVIDTVLGSITRYISKHG